MFSRTVGVSGRVDPASVTATAAKSGGGSQTDAPFVNVQAGYESMLTFYSAQANGINATLGELDDRLQKAGAPRLMG